MINKWVTCCTNIHHTLTKKYYTGVFNSISFATGTKHTWYIYKYTKLGGGHGVEGFCHLPLQSLFEGSKNSHQLYTNDFFSLRYYLLETGKLVITPAQTYKQSVLEILLSIFFSNYFPAPLYRQGVEAQWSNMDLYHNLVLKNIEEQTSSSVHFARDHRLYQPHTY